MAHFILEEAPHNCLFLTLISPGKHNCITPGLIDEMTEALQNLHNNKNVHTLVIRAEGKHFCAGADLTWMQETATMSRDDNKKEARALADLLHLLYTLPQLTIGLLHGAVYGGGVGLAACMDLVLADVNTQFSFAEAKIGLIPSTISPYVVKAIGSRHAKRFFMTAEVFGADIAEKIGLVSEITEGDADARLNLILESVSKGGPEARRAAKKLVQAVDGQDINEQLLDMTAESLADIRATEEAQEGLAAFFEKRQASWIA